MRLKKTAADRRFDERHPGTGLVARIADFEVPVIDVSIGGFKFVPPRDRPYYNGNSVEFELVSLRWPQMKPGLGRGVVRAASRDFVAVQFVRPAFNLMKCVSRHVGTLLWGDSPYGY
jgi:hypothetical protein